MRRICCAGWWGSSSRSSGPAPGVPLRFLFRVIVCRPMPLRHLLILLCAQRSSGQQACVDDGADCKQWAAGGECKANPDYMLANCKKSCNACPLPPAMHCFAHCNLPCAELTGNVERECGGCPSLTQVRKAPTRQGSPPPSFVQVGKAPKAAHLPFLYSLKLAVDRFYRWKFHLQHFQRLVGAGLTMSHPLPTAGESACLLRVIRRTRMTNDIPISWVLIPRVS